jgi:hypothetical protein
MDEAGLQPLQGTARQQRQLCSSRFLRQHG